MKNIIKYFYGIKPQNEITTNDNCNFYFTYENNLYCFCNLSLLELKRITELYSNYFIPSKFHNIIMNKNGSIFSFDKQKHYVLMKINCKNLIVSYVEILNYYKELQINSLMFNNRQVNWYNLWRTKVDYLEYYVQKNETINNNIRCLCNYFIGTSEIAISLISVAMNDYKDDFMYESVTLCHERIKKDYTLYDLYNPKNIILDHYSRDISEYLKTIIFSNDYHYILETVIDKIKFTNVGYMLLLARTIFPTFFFDVLNDIDNSSFDDKNLIKMYDYINRYEFLISKMYLFIRKKIRLPNIEWLANLD